MKSNPFLKRFLISFLGFFVVLNCNSQSAKEKRLERKMLKQIELKKSYDSMGSLINSRTFAFHADLTRKNYTSVNDEGVYYERSVIRFNDSTVFIASPNMPLAMSYKINEWRLEGNTNELTYILRVNAFDMSNRIGVYLRIFSDNTAQAEILGQKFIGRISPN